MRGLLFIVPSLLLVIKVTAFLPSDERPVNCQWSSYGSWSDCDGCTKTQTRNRKIEVYAQFGGIECTGSPYETRPCVPTRGCPIEDGCGNRFRCSSGQCISRALVCNGDHDCEQDSSDEANCDVHNKVCDTDKYPPNTELTGTGYDVITQERKRSYVIHTKSFGGKCRKVYSADNRDYFRLSDNVLTYTFKVEAKNDFSYDFYNSSWSYLKTTEYHRRSNYEGNADDTTYFKYTKDKSYQLLVIKNYVEVAQFINNNPEFLTLAEPFWKELFNLPSVYEYSAYRKLIDDYGTHFLQSGSLGGEYEFTFYMESEKITKNGLTFSDMSKCTSSKGGFIFFSYSSTECKRTTEVIKSSSGSRDQEIRGHAVVGGGDPAFISALSYFSMDNPTQNQKRYSLWAGSVPSLPTIIRFKITPLYELVKEVPCASVKRIFLKRAIEEYIGEAHPCRCKACKNNGQPVIKGRKCECFCKMNTYGEACQYGSALDESPGVIHGSWSCWSSWSMCRGTSGRRVRSRVCNNPAPSGGGKNCIGDSIESQKCEEDELEHLRTVEPHCFDIQILPTDFCPPPPILVNGYILDDDNSYYVGKSIVYSCKSGYTLVGQAVAECKEDLRWHVGAMSCQRLLCSLPRLPSTVAIAPEKNSYQVGDKVKLSCPQGMNLEGAEVISCSSSLTWNPDISEIQCVKKAIPKQDETKCKPWEKVQESVCTCKLPAECSSSLSICAIDARNSRPVALTVCKMHALECLGRKYTLTTDENCKFLTTDKSCGSCQLWETCSDETKTCVCRKAGSCHDKGISICVQVNGTKQTLSECDAGILRCQGQDVKVVSTSSCDE